MRPSVLQRRRVGEIASRVLIFCDNSDLHDLARRLHSSGRPDCRPDSDIRGKWFPALREPPHRLAIDKNLSCWRWFIATETRINFLICKVAFCGYSVTD